MKSKRVQVVCRDEGRVKQSFKEQCDVNKILKKYKQVVGADYLVKFAGQVPQGTYGDFSNMPDYRETLDKINAVDSYFMSLPPQIRARHMNDTATFLDWCADPANKDEMVKMGLVQAPEVDTAQATPTQSDAP